MKIASWNIRHGGSKKKVTSICEQIAKWDPDILGLSEFRESEPSQKIRKTATELGLTHQVSTIKAPERGKNFLFLASRFPIQVQPASGRLNALGRWLHAKINEIDVILIHVPNRSTDKWRFHDETIVRFTELKDCSSVCFGDTNTGRPDIDEENRFFNRREAQWFDRIIEAGWEDVWRDNNPDKREFSWYSNHDNGFRIDQVFAPKNYKNKITNVRYDWGEGGREAGLSDHAAMIFDVG